VLTTAGRDWVPPLRTKLTRQPLRAGDAVAAASPGGGGYGDPLERDAALVERDLNHGYVDREVAERDYGVVVAGETQVAGRARYRLDAERSRALREQRRLVAAGHP